MTPERGGFVKPLVRVAALAIDFGRQAWLFEGKESQTQRIKAMKKICALLLTVLIVTAGCSRLGVSGNGTTKSEDRPVVEFSKIEITGGFQVEWTSGKPALNLTTDENLLALIQTTVSDGTLQIMPTNSVSPTKGMKIILSSASLAEVHLTGGNSFKAGSLAGENFKVISEGASAIDVAGAVTNLEATLTGASSLRAKTLVSANTSLSLVGASSAEVNATEKLKISMQGMGSVIYSGNPKTVEKDVSGLGTIRQQP